MKSKFGKIVLSFVFACVLWLYVVSVVSPESEADYHKVPVVLDGIAALEDRNLMITSDTNLTVDLKLSGNRTDLNDLDKSDITILADLSQIKEPGEHNVRYTISYPSSAGTIEVLSREPQYIRIHVAERVRKEVPVKVDYLGAVPDSFSADIQNAVLDHTTVTVSGPKEVVDQIASANISVDLTGRMDTIVETCRHTLCGADGEPLEDVSLVTVNVSDIRFTVRIYQSKEIPLKILVEGGGGITEDMVTITPGRNSIMVSGSRADLQGLNEIVLGTIKLGELAEDTKYLTFDIVLPEGVTNVTGVTQVTVEVKMPHMETRRYKITNIRVTGVPEGRILQVKTEELDIKLRGPVELLNKISINSIYVVVDCSNQVLVDNQINYLKVTIVIPGMEGVGPIGEYTVGVYVGLIDSGENGV